MTPAEFKAARNALGLSQNDLALVWGMGKNGGRTIRKWEAGDLPVQGDLFLPGDDAIFLKYGLRLRA